MLKSLLPVRLFAAVLFLALSISIPALEPRDYAVELTANVQKSPARITLNWRAATDGSAFTVARRAKDSTAWSELASLPAGSTSYVDNSVSAGQGYEYRVMKNPVMNNGGSGYIYAGIDLPLVEDRGKVVLIVDSTYTAQLEAELARLQQDLVGDGWTVLRNDVARNATPPQVKALIKADYQADPQNVKAVFLFGHVPVPYSGNINPDGHPDHLGAWPADSYYGDMDGNWTDSSVNSTSAPRQQNKNVPGDGKFDQSTFPSAIELQVGRVDLANLPGFAPKTELDLLRNYLNKDNNFRHGRLAVQRRALINDNFGIIYGEAFGASGWRNFAPFFGPDKITSIPGYLYFQTLKDNSYLWSFASGGGAYNYCNYVGGTGEWNTTDSQTVFTFLIGSYFGDWDADNCFLRGPLGGASYGLTSAWAGRPHWYVHHMAMGETIGYGTKTSMNSSTAGYHPRQYENMVHEALMGDPTLRMHPVIPPSRLIAIKGTGGAQLSWTPSLDPTVVGYNVYKASGASGPFTRVNASLVQGAAFLDTGAPGSSYMVRAVKLEQTPSGTYYNASQGVFATPAVGETGGNIPLTIRPGAGEVLISFPSLVGKSYIIEASPTLINPAQGWTVVGNVTSAGTTTTVSQPVSGKFNFYRVRQSL